ncbi:MAG TPA: STAS domain-containing protein [Steroidobacteraceae bacterium]|jgi:anti-anti-sigma factor
MNGAQTTATNTRIEHVAGTLRVTGEMTVYSASQIKQPLLDTLANDPGDITLDLSAVTEFDTAGLQLLLLARHEALASNRDLRVTATSGIVRETLTLSGALKLLVGQP